MAGLRGSPEGPFSGDGEPVAVVQGAAERKPRSDGADDEDRAGREQRVAHADERRYEAAEGEADGAQQRRGRAGVLARQSMASVVVAGKVMPIEKSRAKTSIS